MLSHTKIFTFILTLVILIPNISLSQNKQNKYYNPFRISVSALTKFVMEPKDDLADKYLFDQGFGVVGEVIYTIDQKAKFEISLEAGFMGTFSNTGISMTNKYLIPVSLNAFYYFFDETFSPFIGIGYGFENFDNSNKYIIKPFVGISNEKLKAFARFGIRKGIGSSLEIGIGYSFKERPCGCFPQSR